MSDIKIKYPATSTVALTLGLASLADDNTNGVAGRESNAVDNSSVLDIDHLLSGKIRTGTSPTASRTIEVWVYAAISIASGTPTNPDVYDGTDSAETVTSLNVLQGALRPAATMVVDNTTGRDYFFPPISIASLFGGTLPMFWGVFIVNRTGVALDSTAGNHVLSYLRVQNQVV